MAAGVVESMQDGSFFKIVAIAVAIAGIGAFLEWVNGTRTPSGTEAKPDVVTARSPQVTRNPEAVVDKAIRAFESGDYRGAAVEWEEISLLISETETELRQRALDISVAMRQFAESRRSADLDRIQTAVAAYKLALSARNTNPPASAPSRSKRFFLKATTLVKLRYGVATVQANTEVRILRQSANGYHVQIQNGGMEFDLRPDQLFVYLQ